MKMIPKYLDDKRSSLFALAAVLVIAAVIIFVVPRVDSDERIVLATASFETLRRAPVAEDKLPTWYGQRNSENLQLESSRAVGKHDGSSFFLALSETNEICLVAILGKEDAATTCNSAEGIADTGLLLETSTAGQSIISAVAIPDGFNRATIGPTATELERSDALIVVDKGKERELTLVGQKYEPITVRLLL